MGNPIKKIIRERGIERFGNISNRALDETFRRKHAQRKRERAISKKHAEGLEKEVKRLRML